MREQWEFYLVTTASGLALSALAWLLKRIDTVLDQLHEVRTNQQVMQQWQQLHEQADEERSAHLDERLKELRVARDDREQTNVNTRRLA